MLATQYAEWHNIQPQQDCESDNAFKNRVSGTLRDAGNIIESHEVAQDKRYDEDGGDMVMSGIAGAAAMAMQEKDYGSRGSSRVGDEIAAGVIAQAIPKPKMSVDEVMLMMAMFG